MTLGAGTDVVAVGRIAGLIQRRGRAFLDRWFTPDEIAYCNAKARPPVHFAAHFAAKEAVFKALPLRWDGPIPWRHIEIRQDAHQPGQATVRLSGDLLTQATGAGVGTIVVSLTRGATHAMAVALADRA